MADLLQPKKINYLEGLRGVAAFMVLFHHFMLAFYPAAYDGNPSYAHAGTFDRSYYESPLNVITNGNFCVTIFFVLSGYVLSARYFREKIFSVITSAAKRRFFRLFIPVGFVIILSFILLQLNAYKHLEFAAATLLPNSTVSNVPHSDWWLKTLWPMDSSVGTFFRYFFIDVMFRGSGDYVTSMWTLAMELYGSFIVFGLLAIIHLMKKRYLVYIITLVIMIALEKYYYTAFVMGMMLNDVEAIKIKFKGQVFNSILVILLLLGGLLLGSYPSWPGFAPFGFWKFMYDLPNGSKIVNSNLLVLIHILGSMMVVTAVVLSGLLQKILSTRFFVFLGLISFSFYLIHPLVLGAFTFPLFMKLYPEMEYNQAALVVLLATVLLTILLSWLMAITVDRFSLSFTKKYFGNASDRKKLVPVKVDTTSLDQEEVQIKRRKKKKR